jgi:hypothetical protein
MTSMAKQPPLYAETTTPRGLCSLLTRSIGVDGDWEPATEVDLCSWSAHVHIEFTIGEPAIARSVQVMDQAGRPTPITALALADDQGHRVDLRQVETHRPDEISVALVDWSTDR